MDTLCTFYNKIINKWQIGKYIIKAGEEKKNERGKEKSKMGEREKEKKEY